jgi:acetyl esterase/lipase
MAQDAHTERTADAAERMQVMFGGREVDPQMAEVLDMLTSLHGKPIEQLDPDEARKQPTPAMAVQKLLDERGLSTEPEGVLKVEAKKIDGLDGDIELRIYTPASAREGQSLPVVLYVHGGGWVIADLDVYDASPRALCNAAHAIIVSTHYRQGPEHRFPAAHDDVYAAYQWTLAHAGDIGGDPARIAIVGESAGGNMAATVSMRARDDGIQLPLHQVLVYPVADYSMSTESYREMAHAKPLDSGMMAWFFEHYLDGAADGASPYISLVNADLAGLPPTTIISAELDPLRSEGEQLAQQLTSAGVETRQKTFEGVTHEFFGMGVVVDKAAEAVQVAAHGLIEAFGTERHG